MANIKPVDALLAEQTSYYRARAAEYDAWWQRRGRYDRGPEESLRWRSDVAEAEGALDRFAPRGRVLELACGTGWWTERLARFADSLTCVDASSEVIGINAQRLRDAGLAMPSYVEADLFAWLPTETFDVVFFSFWLSHVPPDRFEAFWALVDRLLAPGGRVFFIDSQRDGTSVSFDPLDMANYDGVQARELKDGRRGSA